MTPRSAPLGMARMLAMGGLLLVVLVIAYLLFLGGGGAEYKLIFQDAGQLVKGDQVEVGGLSIGSVTNIVLRKDNKAEVTIHVNSSLTPLHEGTRAEIRVPSLSSVAARYITLTPGPNNKPSLRDGETLPASNTEGVVDLDQVFNALNPKTRKGLQNVFRGFAEWYAGNERNVGLSTEYFAPSLTSVNHIFSELTRERSTFTKFLVSTSQALGVIASRKEQLTDLVENANKTFQAVGNKQTQLTQALRELPGTLNQGTRTFTDIGPTLADFRKLIDVSKVDTKPLVPFFSRLRPLLAEATPVVHELSLAIDRAGPNNDLTDAALALPGLAQALSTGSPDGVKALEESVPVTAMFGPYSPDLQGLFRDFGQDTGYYDADGHYARVSPGFDNFKAGEKNSLTPTTPLGGLQGLKTVQLRRCPGSATQPTADGSAPFTDEGKLSCDPSETP